MDSWYQDDALIGYTNTKFKERGIDFGLWQETDNGLIIPDQSEGELSRLLPALRRTRRKGCSGVGLASSSGQGLRDRSHTLRNGADTDGLAWLPDVWCALKRLRKNEARYRALVQRAQNKPTFPVS